MEVMQRLRTEVEKKKEVIHHLKEDLEEVVEEALSKRRSSNTTSRTTSDGSTLTTVSSVSSEITSSSSGDVSAELNSIDEPVNAEGGDGDKKQENSVYLDKSEGTEIEWSQLNVKVDDLAAKLKGVDIRQVMSAVINGKQVETPQDKTSTGPGKNEHETAGTYELEESDEEVVELEFETAVEKMHTHDGYGMYCPNCSNRITKVVLRRKIRQRRIPVSSDNERRDLFGCLWCFRIFVSSGNRLNPFRIFGADRGSEANVQLFQEQPASDGTMPSSVPSQAAGRGFDLFWLFRKGRDQENANTSPLLTEAETQSSSTTITQKPRDEVIEQGRRFDLFWLFRKGRDHKNALTSPLPAAAGIQSSSTTVTYKPRDDGNEQGMLPLLAAGIQSSSTTVTYKPRDDGNEQGLAASQQGKDKNSAKIGSSGDSSGLQTPPPQGSAQNGNVIIDVGKPENLIQGMKQPILQPELFEIIGQTNTYYQPKGDDVRIPVVETPPGTEIPETEVISTGAPRPVISTESGGSTRSLEIVKSVVYGGLLESMASLSVVSSAAASDATTLNIVVLGLANLVGGLVVLAHNLRDLRFGDSNQTNERRYKEELGRKEHFLVHAVVAVLSYIIFGLIPPVVYGFTFRETNERDLKMLAVAAASFLCIFILAIAKAYVRGEHKFMTYFKTVLYYITSAVAASGIAFAVGELAEKLVQRLGWLDPAAAVGSQLFPEPNSFRPTWASY